jgi:hypothetical protein
MPWSNAQAIEWKEAIERQPDSEKMRDLKIGVEFLEPRTASPEEAVHCWNMAANRMVILGLEDMRLALECCWNERTSERPSNPR